MRPAAPIPAAPPDMRKPTARARHARLTQSAPLRSRVPSLPKLSSARKKPGISDTLRRVQHATELQADIYDPSPSPRPESRPVCSSANCARLRTLGCDSISHAGLYLRLKPSTCGAPRLWPTAATCTSIPGHPFSGSRLRQPVQEPEKMTKTIVEALEITGQRGIINKGWGGLGNLAEPKDFVYLLDNVPHDWLFLRCKAVVHHGGAGTTAAGLKAACPTTIVPFFGDQPFWGERVHARGLGPVPVPIDQFSLQKLVESIRFMMDPQVKQRAVELAKAMESEDGVTGAVKAFFKHLPRNSPPAAAPHSPSILSALGPVKKCFCA